MRSFKEFIKDRGNIVVRVAICLLFDAIILCFWLAIAWGIGLFASYLESKGVHEYCAKGFKWASSLSILLLALIYITKDIIMAFKDCFGNEDKESKELL
jgi:hypothetical protein